MNPAAEPAAKAQIPKLLGENARRKERASGMAMPLE
jgi:hypothetical protein